MAWAFRAKANSSVDVGATSGNATVPTNVDGDLLILEASINDDVENITTPSGWTLIRNTANATRAMRSAWYWRVASSEPASYTVSVVGSTSVRWNFAIRSYSGINTGAGIDVEGGTAGGAASATATSPSVTTTAANDLVLVHAHNNENATNVTWTPDSSPAVTERYEEEAGVNRPHTTGGDFNKATAGATGAIDSVASVSARWIAHTAAFKEDTGGASHPLAADESGTSSDSGTLKIGHPLVASETATSSDSGTLKIGHPLVASEVATSSDSGALTIGHPLSADDTGPSSDQGSLTIGHPLGTDESGTSSDGADLTIPMFIYADEVGTSSDEADLTEIPSDRIFRGSEIGRSKDGATLSYVAASVRVIDIGRSSDDAHLSSDYFQLSAVDVVIRNDAGRSSDRATLT